MQQIVIYALSLVPGLLLQFFALRGIVFVVPVGLFLIFGLPGVPRYGLSNTVHFGQFVTFC